MPTISTVAETGTVLHKSQKDFWARHGFKPLRPGKMHLHCPQCGRKMSNMERSEYDPPHAALLVIPCDKYQCSGGCKIEGGDYFDSEGRPIDPFGKFEHDQHNPGHSGKDGHYCNDFDGLWICADCQEYECCSCVEA